jgi:hypothetical protein
MRKYGRVEVQLKAFLTSEVDVGEWPALSPGRFTSRERAPLLIGQEEAGWAPGPVWTLWRTDTSLAPAGNRNKIPSSSSRLSYSEKKGIKENLRGYGAFGGEDIINTYEAD